MGYKIKKIELLDKYCGVVIIGRRKKHVIFVFSYKQQNRIVAGQNENCPVFTRYLTLINNY